MPLILLHSVPHSSVSFFLFQVCDVAQLGSGFHPSIRKFMPIKQNMKVKSFQHPSIVLLAWPTGTWCRIWAVFCKEKLGNFCDKKHQKNTLLFSHFWKFYLPTSKNSPKRKHLDISDMMDINQPLQLLFELWEDPCQVWSSFFLN